MIRAFFFVLGLSYCAAAGHAFVLHSPARGYMLATDRIRIHDLVRGRVVRPGHRPPSNRHHTNSAGTLRPTLGGFSVRGTLLMSGDKPFGLQSALATALILVTTIGATAIPFLSAGPETPGRTKTVRVLDDDGREITRGSMTAMTRSEIQKKLSQVPVFFVRDSNGGVTLSGNEGSFFMAPQDAQAQLKAMGAAAGDAKVAATTLDDVWFPLIKKKGANTKPVAAQASTFSDPNARYRLVPRADQVAQASQTAAWSSFDDQEGVPVWVADTLAFQGMGRTKMPLFTNVDDLMTSWDRLQASGGTTTDAPRIQVSTIGAIVDRMAQGGAENRLLEFFADMNAIEQAEKLL